ncbi:hypothetical protein, partial [Armatimonas sp.]|uniref:hypothetical protein n=1 Tax=Armatimonas sp. TaxID=1872638 RepID=UPI00286B58C1
MVFFALSGFARLVKPPSYLHHYKGTTDYDIPKDEDAQDKLMDKIRQDGAILATSKPGQFTLRFVAKKQRVTFAASRDSAGWRVAESGREPYLAPKPTPVGFLGPAVTLTRRDQFELRSPTPQTQHPIRQIQELIATVPGQLAFLRDQKDLVVVTEQGVIVHTASLASIPLKENDSLSKILWRGGTRFLIFVEHTGTKEEQRYSEAYQVDVATG